MLLCAASFFCKIDLHSPPLTKELCVFDSAAVTFGC